MNRRWRWGLVVLLGAGCDEEPTPAVTVPVGLESASSTAAPSSPPARSAASAPPAPPPAPSSATTQEQLLALLPPFEEKARPFILRHVDIGGPGAMNQGNPELSTHAIPEAKCREGLADVTLQTDAQRERCGHDLMVPIYPDGDPTQVKSCIDVFEFPNRPCELPFVFVGATIGREVCKRVGKRLCTQEEWMLACAGDPGGGGERRYAYGDELDLTACNTNKPAATYQKKGCDPSTVKSTWETCGTHTEPSGAFPKCRSRFGVYDLHGNVAEAMTRWDHEEGETVSQLKGSAFFYVDVHRKVTDPPSKETYLDVCRHNPRWHVQSMKKAWHVNYHLGFRCCVDVE